jgi:uncharacterized membrane protein
VERTRTAPIRSGGWLLVCAGLGGAGWALLRADFPGVLAWWACLFVIGLVSLPLTQTVLGGFHDRGYPFSKVMGVGLCAYVSWLASSLGLMPLARWSAALLLVLLGAAVTASRKWRSDLIEVLTRRKTSIMAQECLFAALLGLWSYVRGLRPDIHGLEKFMDYGFAASIARSGFMPPPDMWFAGHSINYYYFGHYVLAFLSDLSGVRLSVAYNLMVATLLAFCFTLTLSLTSQLVRAGRGPARLHLLAGVVSATLLTFGGNLHTFVFAYAAPALQEVAPKMVGPTPSALGSYSYAEATRYVGYRPPTEDKTIHEFPFYSFVVSDLHAHVSDIPFVLTLLAILTAAFLEPANPSPALTFLGISLPLRLVLAAAVALALFRMTNAWDLPIYLCVTAAVVFARGVVRARSFREGLKDAVLTTSLVVVVCWALTLPFNDHFENHYSQLGWVHTHTPLRQLLVLWGVPFVLLLLYVSVGASSLPSPWGRWQLLRHPATSAARLPPADLLVLVFVLCALGLVAGPELVYVQDIYGPQFYRANTFFKLSYQAFILFGVVIGFLAARVLASHGGVGRMGRSRGVKTLCGLVLMLPLLYAPYAVSGYYGSLRSAHYRGLEGLAFLDGDGGGDGASVRWLNENLSGSAVVLEANGDSFTEYGRVSMATGLPTILGWFAHEGLWRGSMKVPEERAAAVSLVYESNDLARTTEVLGKYGVRFIVVGELERRRFPRLNERKLLSLGDVVFEAGRTRIIEVRR